MHNLAAIICTNLLQLFFLRRTFLFFFFFFQYLVMYLAVLGLSCSMWYLQSSLCDVEHLFFFSCGMQNFYLQHARSFTCGLLNPVSGPGSEPWPPALEAWSLSCWTTREVPRTLSLYIPLFCLQVLPYTDIFTFLGDLSEILNFQSYVFILLLNFEGLYSCHYLSVCLHSVKFYCSQFIVPTFSLPSPVLGPFFILTYTPCASCLSSFFQIPPSGFNSSIFLA